MQTWTIRSNAFCIESGRTFGFLLRQLGDMAEGGRHPPQMINNAPSIFKVDIWAKFFKLYELRGKNELDKMRCV